MSDTNAQQGHDHASQDEPVVGGYGDQGEAEALLGESDAEQAGDQGAEDPKDDPKADPAEGSDPEHPHGL